MFVSFEGIDGSGKSTQARLLSARLQEAGSEVVLTREPGGTPLGEAVRDLLLHAGDVAPWAEAALFAASRAQHVEELIRPALARGAVVVCDRYVDSSVAYQGGARELGIDAVLDLNLAAVGGRHARRHLPAPARAGGGGGARGLDARPDRARGRIVPEPRRRRLPGARGAVPGADRDPRRRAAAG